MQLLIVRIELIWLLRAAQAFYVTPPLDMNAAACALCNSSCILSWQLLQIRVVTVMLPAALEVYHLLLFDKVSQ